MKGDNTAGKDTNPDPITGEPGFHPIGNVVGGVPGAAAGAAIGAVGGPIGIIIGAAIGGLVGGATGDAVAEMLNPSDVDKHWQNEYTKYKWGEGKTYDQVRGPLYFGTQERLRSGRKQSAWNRDVESDLERKWESSKYRANQNWQDAKEATKSAYVQTSDALERALPGDADRDGR